MNEAMAASITDPALRAALMVMILDEGQAVSMLAKLEPDELEKLGKSMCALQEVGGPDLDEALINFIERIEKSPISTHDNEGKVRRLMTVAHGEVKAENIMQRIRPDKERTSPLQLIRWLNPASLVPLIKDENPQAIAVLIAFLDRQVGAMVLTQLPRELQGEVVRRIASLGKVRDDALVILEEVLERRITEHHGQSVLTAGGPREAAELINNADRDTESLVMPSVETYSPELAQQIRDEMFTFRDILKLDVRNMGILLRDIESEMLVVALKALTDEELAVFFAAMSDRAAEGLRDEMEERQRVRLSEVEEARRQIVIIARRMVDDGTLETGTSDDEYA
ncbi:flagellar motor switch protein FliG [Croceicoccus gelatinilyticus]|uniref:flagellar motor switch protein FliG n=1 Tax=Croceicoccus gelatinilyticus TaxID=2835536 RepID=UPI001BCD86AE|nr:flagellar motor switch protein FliG [Croceicoccus gelatinilyticus]MBS7671331.1 flagellar motor switch protein FliG [Croceicoccus gelatinilyticus]